MPVAKRGLKKIASNQLVKEAGKKMLEHGIGATTEILANAIDPNVESDPLQIAKQRLNSARSEIANVVRNTNKNKRKSINESMDSQIRPMKKRKVVKIKTNSRKKQKKYNLFEDV